MPTSLPVATLVRARQQLSGADPVVLSCAALGAAATALAVFVGYVCGDPAGAVLTLTTVGVLIGVFLHKSR